VGQEVGAQHQKAARPGLPASCIIGSTACTGWLRADHFRCAHSAAGSPTADRQTTPKGQGTPPKTGPQPDLPQPPTPEQTKGHCQPRRRTAIGFSATSLTFGRWRQPGSPLLGQTSGLHQPLQWSTTSLSAHVAHLPVRAGTCHPGVETNFGLAPNSPTNGFRAHGPHTCQPYPSSTGHGLLLPFLSFRPWRHFRQPVKPGHISGLRQFGPQTDFGRTAPIGPPSTGPNAPLPPMLPLPPLPANLTLPCQKDAPLPS